MRIVCGKGNNGGDGLVAARKLIEQGIPAEAFLLWAAQDLSEDARANHDRLPKQVEARQCGAAELPAALAESGVVVDALLGTGFSGVPRAPLDRAIEAINDIPCPVVAVDVPSGADASTGEVSGACVRAEVTVTFHAAKVGLWVRPAKAHAGRIEVIDIGIPEDDAGVEPAAGLITRSALDLVPRRDPDSTKFSSGSVLVIGGSTGLTGAVAMTCDAAMRAGAGWVRAGVPGSLNAILEQKLTEVMTIALPDRDGALLRDAATELLAAAERADAVVLGPGLGRADQSFELAQAIIGELDRPLLVDADGLNALAAAGLEAVARRTAPTVLTPHAGELARLLGTESAQVSARRLQSVRDAAARARSVVVLKGDDTLVAEGSARLAVNAGGSAALATAGTGDVLSGVIAAFMAKGVDPFTAASAGVYAHSQAGWLAAAEQGAESVIATDVIAALPGALRRPDGESV